jgi:dATP pyrophosphohydrolase
MARAPLQVLVLPFRHRADGRIEYAVFRRADHVDDCWQGLAGGAEAGESAEQAARREMMEEAGIAADAPLIALDAIAGIAVDQFDEHEQWGPEVYIVIERAFAARVPDEFSIAMSREHTAYRWLSYEEAVKLLKWDSNKTALWELNERLRRGDPTAG